VGEKGEGMKLLNIPPQLKLDDALEVIEILKQDISSGKVIGFFAVGIDSEDSSYGYAGTTKRVSRLRLIGAMTSALTQFQINDTFVKEEAP
jgi:hypothetical protein